MYIDNHIRRLFAPRRGQKVVVETDGTRPTKISVFGTARSVGEHDPSFKVIKASYNSSTSTINVTIFEERRGSSIPLTLNFVYKPGMGFAPIHEVADGRNRRIKEFYWKLWFGDNEVLPEINVHDTFTGPEVTIDEDDVETFCAVVGNQGEAFKSARSETPLAPMDFAIVTGWRAVMKAIFPASINDDLLKLVHLSNGFCLLDGTKPLKAGDVCKAEARIVAVTRGDKRVIEVVSSFLYRGRFNDFENTFQVTEEPDYVVELPSDAAVGVLQSKEWFDWDDETKPLQAGTTLIFRVHSEVTYRNKTCFKEVNVSGEIFVRDQIKRLVKVGSVDFLDDDSKSNPVVEYIKRHGKPQGLVSPLANDGYTMTTHTSTVFPTPATNEPYSKVSGDFNPIHINPYFANYASLPGTITHGMWSSAATRRYVETVVAEGKPERVIVYDVVFVGMVLPGDELQVKIKHTGMRSGNFVVNVETVNSRGEKVIAGTAEVAQPNTVYVFTGQGSQEPGMGMDLYNNSPAARSVSEAADAHLTAVHGFSIVEIVKDNWKEVR
ncbi:MaoC like domain-containing protein [Trametes maxima]|nr:MaoC like domain-containing protein [Trametes maxima]